MTDEELGRKWAEKHGKTPHNGDEWWAHEAVELNDTYASTFPEWLSRCIKGGVAGIHPSESAAYAALGAALRKLLAFADGVREVTG